MLTNARQDSLEQALKKVNEHYDNNIMFKSFRANGKKIRFTLKVVSSKDPGHRVSLMAGQWGGNPRRSIAACWHVHGRFFDALFEIEPDAYVYSRGRRLKITKDYGNWQDWNCGSIMYPIYMSESCECEELVEK